MKKMILTASVIILSVTVFETSFASEIKPQHVKPERNAREHNAPGAEIWGRVQIYRGDSITLENGQTYRFSKNVLVDVENLAQNKKGNVRIVLDLNGKAEFVLFHGIDMPEMFRRFGR